jgi:hypothetical protein
MSKFNLYYEGKVIAILHITNDYRDEFGVRNSNAFYLMNRETDKTLITAKFRKNIILKRVKTKKLPLKKRLELQKNLTLNVKKLNEVKSSAVCCCWSCWVIA